MTMSSSAPPASSVATENARILIVDDEDANLMVLRRMLERAGYTNLQTLNDSSLVVERFVSFEPDLPRAVSRPGAAGGGCGRAVTRDQGSGGS